MIDKDMRASHKEFVDYSVKKSQKKDSMPQKNQDNVDVREVEALVKRIKDKIKV